MEIFARNFNLIILLNISRRMRSDAFENFYLFFWYSTFNKNKEVEIFFKLFFQHREEFLKINFCY